MVHFIYVARMIRKSKSMKQLWMLFVTRARIQVYRNTAATEVDREKTT